MTEIAIALITWDICKNRQLTIDRVVPAVHQKIDDRRFFWPRVKIVKPNRFAIRTKGHGPEAGLVEIDRLVNGRQIGIIRTAKESGDIIGETIDRHDGGIFGEMGDDL